MSIADDIEALAVGFRTANPDRRATKLFLGAVEWGRLERLAESSGAGMRLCDRPGNARTEYRGMKIYRVDDGQFLGVL